MDNFCLSLSNMGLEVSPDEKIFTPTDERGFLPYTLHRLSSQESYQISKTMAYLGSAEKVCWWGQGVGCGV